MNLLQSQPRLFNSRKGSIQELKTKEARLQHSIAYHKSLFMPIPRLFPELLSEIFTHCLEYESHSVVPGFPGFVQPSIDAAPLLLLQVSVGWRDLASKTSRLWTNMIIDGDTDPDLLSAWLSRSGTGPLDPRLENYDSFFSLHFQTQPMASLDLVALCRRLRHLDIDILLLESPLQSPLFPGDPVDMPFLESLNVCLDNTGNNLTHGLSPLASTPRLRHCHVDTWRGLSFYTSFPWSQLTHLYMGDQADVLDVLRRCGNLVVLELAFETLYSDSLSSTFRPVLLAHLTRLRIHHVKTASGYACFDLPSLHGLRIAMGTDQHLKSLPLQCGRHLKELSLENSWHLSPKEVEKCLAFMPQLRVLKIDHVDILRILNRSVAGNERRLLPRLQSIDIALEPCLVDVVEFIEQRWNRYEANLESIQEIYVWPAKFEAPSAEQLSFLRKCVDEGLIMG